MWMNTPRDRDRRDRDRDHGTASEHAGQAVTAAGAAAVLVALWPAAVVAAAALAAAWGAGLHHLRLLHAAAWSLVLTFCYLVAAVVQDQPWLTSHLTAWEMQPWTDYRAATLGIIHGHLAAALLMLPEGLPAGLAIAGVIWAWRCRQMTTGLGGRTAISVVRWDDRQWRRQARTARWDNRAPGRVPLATRSGGVPVGTVIRTVQARWSRVLTIPATEFGRHTVLVGATGSGKTTAMIRLWSGWFAAMLRSTGAKRPQLIVIDGKGGPDSRSRAAETAAALHAAGARRVALWPDRAALSLWSLPPEQLATTLHQLIESGDGAAAYYSDMSAATVRLAVCAPCGPPATGREFLDRLTPAWLGSAYAHGSPAERQQVAAAREHLSSIAMRYAQLLDRLGPALDGTGRFTDPNVDVWYCILEGTSEPSVAEAQAMALTELAARAATSPGSESRQILLAADDYSAVSRRVPLSNLYERGRSLGIGLMVSAQSWEGLGDSDDERGRIVSTADGGVFILRTPSPEPFVSLAGTVKIIETGHKITGPGRTGDEGSSRVQHTWTVDPNRIRRLDTGQAAYVRHGGVTFVQVAPVPAARYAAPIPPPPAQATAPAVAAAPTPAPWPGTGPAPAPADPGPHENDVLGPAPADPHRGTGS